MDTIIQNFIETIDQLQISVEEKNKLFCLIEDLKKNKRKNDFKQNRFTKDKSIAVNLLNATIEDLEKKKKIIEESNSALVEHKKLIEHKNNVLELQKIRIEEQTIRLEENFEKLTASYQDLEQFTYIASHDLKSPLRTICNFGQLLKRRLGNNIETESKKFLDYMIKGAKQMNTVICDLLEFAHVRNKHTMESVFELEVAIKEVKFNLTEVLEKEKVTILYKQLPHVYGFQSGVIQLFQNLIGNAIKFKKNDLDPIIKITCEDREKEFYFEVKDNGVGMEKKYEQKAFMPFQRINNLDRPGSGIGLAICKKVVNQHGGKIWYNSELGKGTTFCFTLSKN